MQFLSYGVNTSERGGQLATYRYASAAITPVATATDVLTLHGSASKIIRVTRLKVTGVATAQAAYPTYIIKRTAANTGGTATNPDAVKADSLDAAATGVLTLYSANPSALGAGVAFDAETLLLTKAADPTAFPLPFDRAWGIRTDKQPVLRGVAEALAINFAGAGVPAGAAINFILEWTESDA